MKSTLGLEMIGGKPLRSHTGIHQIDDLFDLPYPCWCAEIKGFGIKFRFDREFIQGKNDYSRANSKGTRGIFCYYILESDHIYEVKEPLSWSRAERYFCRVSDDGEIVRITEKEVEAFCERECLRKYKEKYGERKQTPDGD
ncbi:MAG: hypothetical protein WC294_10290 [Methanoregula sp.]|jgi:hypothetical protein